MFFLIKHVQMCKYASYRRYPITYILHQFQDMQMPEKSNTITKESGHGTMALTILTPHTHFTPPTSCDENEQNKQQKYDILHKNYIMATSIT